MAPAAAPPDKTNSEKFIKSLKIKKSTCKRVEKEDCPICLNDFEDDEEVCFLDCTHKFHHNCIVQWVREKNTCPLCRRKLYEKHDHSIVHVATIRPSENYSNAWRPGNYSNARTRRTEIVLIQDSRRTNFSTEHGGIIRPSENYSNAPE